MNSSLTSSPEPSLNSLGMNPNWKKALVEACGRIAPTWPLDQMIAVNPWWQQRHQSFADVIAHAGVLAGVRGLMPHEYYAQAWKEHKILPEHLLQAKMELACEDDVNTLVQQLEQEPPFEIWNCVSDLIDQTRDRRHRMSWKDEITHQLSQSCGSQFQRSGELALHQPVLPGLYSRWLKATQSDRGVVVLMGEPSLVEVFMTLPQNIDELFNTALQELDLPDHAHSDYAHGLLMSIGGWAAWVAYLEWLNPDIAAKHSLMLELLAMRMAWDLVLWRLEAQKKMGDQHLNTLWRHQANQFKTQVEQHGKIRQITWVWQRALEIAFQKNLVEQLKITAPKPSPSVLLQAIFCIDVRSETMRKALEAQHSDIQTLGFAGFFGLPVEYAPRDSELVRPQLPGLINASIRLTEREVQPNQKQKFHQKALWKRSIGAAPAMFSLVEATGLASGYHMLKDTFFPSKYHHPVNHHHCSSGHFIWTQGGQELKALAKAEIISGILKAMNLTTPLAPQVMLVGHGSQSCNNPQSAGLDCGACGGQTGEVNVKALAEALNDKEVRTALIALGVDIPKNTRFIPALHYTTTDEIVCFNSISNDPQLEQWLNKASLLARQMRNQQGNNEPQSDEQLNEYLHQKSVNRAQVRPEWGLAGNAAFIVAPRYRTAHLNLKGRSFLHDYQWSSDNNFEILEKIMTAPMVVTNWINMQYYASVTDPDRYGSGNKLLHNVVGGHIGVFEGNGGDLRCGLSFQSVNDGKTWRHEPLRLSVFIAAPRAAIEKVVQNHLMVQQLIDNDWLYVFRWGDKNAEVEAFYKGCWKTW